MSLQPRLKTQPSPPTELHLFDSPRQSLEKDKSMKDRFKMNQIDLKNKFKHYLATQKFKYPLACKYFSEQEEESEEMTLRSVMKQKKQFLLEMQTNLNSSHYLENKKKEQERTFYILKNKFHKVESIKQTKKTERQKVKKTLVDINRQHKQEKLKYRKQIEESRVNIAHSKMACEEKKIVFGYESRKEKLENSLFIEQQREEEYELKKHRCESLREKQKHMHLIMSRVRENKKSQADQMKLERLMRELAQKQEIKIASSRIKDVSERRKTSINRATKAIENKIEHFRKSLGERRLSPQPRIVVKFARKSSSLTQDIESSTFGGHFHSSHHHSHTEEASNR